MPSPSLGALISHARCVLLDFDGPVCRVFAGVPAPAVAERLLGLLSAEGVDLPREPEIIADPLAVFRRTGPVAPHLVRLVEAELRRSEVEAVRTAEPTPGAADLIAACVRSGRPVAIVSNNSAEAVTGYLERNVLSEAVRLVVGRTEPDPELLKPSPHLVRQALRELGVPPDEAVLVGDSVSDVEAGIACGVPVIGYANRPGKYDRLSGAGADLVVTDLTDIVDACGWRRTGGPS